MCKCRILEAANVDAYLFDNMVIEELAIQDVVKATTLDFACTVDRLKRTPENPFLLHGLPVPLQKRGDSYGTSKRGFLRFIRCL